MTITKSINQTKFKHIIILLVALVPDFITLFITL